MKTRGQVGTGTCAFYIPMEHQLEGKGTSASYIPFLENLRGFVVIRGPKHNLQVLFKLQVGKLRTQASAL